MSITVSYELQQQDVQCGVCFEDMSLPLIKRSTGNYLYVNHGSPGSSHRIHLSYSLISNTIRTFGLTNHLRE